MSLCCEGLFIRNWKTVVVRPLLTKTQLRINQLHFRPVSNLSFLSKVIESCMLLQLNQNCKKYGLQPDYQSAYREHHSCETAILQAKQWHLMEYGETVNNITCHYRPICSLWHSWPWILLDILEHKFGIEGKALQWFNNYLRPRSFKVITDVPTAKNRT